MTKTLKDLIENIYEEFEYKYNHREESLGYPMGFYDLDIMTDGLKKAELTVIAGRPASGKTSLALNICSSVAKSNIPICFITYEITNKALVQRLLYQEAEVDSQRMRTGNMQAKDWKKLTNAMSLVHDSSIQIEGQCQFDFENLSESIRHFVSENSNGVVIIDYFQLIKLPEKEERYVELSSLACSLKRLAMELNIPIILLSQVSKKCEDGSDKRPELSDIAECDALAWHADNVYFIYRDEQYYRDDTENRCKAEIIIAKQKNGPTGTIDLLFQSNITKFKNITKSSVF